MIKITKFGGSSVANAEQFRKVKNIIEADPSRRFVVISAAGKASSEDNKITDLLYLCHAHVKYHVDYHGIFDIIKKRFTDIKDELGLSLNIEKELEELSDMLPKLSTDELVSRGEYFTSRMMAEYLKFPFVDAADVIKINYDGSIDFEATDENLQFIMKDHDRFVIPGFYGTTPDGNIKVMSRGGSDITGSILARCLGADLYENWTDVSGFLMADPRIVKDPLGIKMITYSELRELSYMGASVLHEDAVFPVKEANIPINILNTNRPEDKGTIILDTIPKSEDKVAITGIAGKKGFCALAISKKHMPESVGFCRKILSVFEKYGVSVEHLPTGIDSIGMIIQEKYVHNCLYDIIAEIKEKAEPDDIKYIPDLALIATVGRNMSSRIGTSGKLFTALGKNDVNVKIMIQAFNEINILVGVDESDMEKGIRAIYDAFVRDKTD
ncbi:MAG TPA: aspartate kinase [Candidatus Avilachnospira avicola]|nr:aspartate kinase [Candidatus Avilachnospira avicola]